MKEKKVSWLELFFDLVFVTAVSFSTHLLIEIDEYPQNVLRYFGEYFLMIFPMFWLWIGQTMLFNRFSECIKNPSLFVLPQMFFLILMSASFDFDFSHTYYAFLIGYLGVRILTLIQYFGVQKKQQGVQKHVSSLLLRIFSIGLFISFLSIFANDNTRYLIMYAGIFIDMLLPIYFSNDLKQIPVHLPHLAERLGLFVLITFGETLVSVADLLVGNTGDWNLLIYSFSAFLVITLMWFSYFYDHDNKLNHEKITNGQVLLYGHFLIFISVMLFAANIHLLYENHLNRDLLLNLLFGSFLLFFLSKYVVFYYHKKNNSSLYEKESLLLFCFVFLLYLINFFLVFSFTTILYLLSFLCFIEIFIQQGLHKKIRASK